MGDDAALKGEKLPLSHAPVNGQALCEYANIPFGWFHIGYNGCLVLAIYNALLLSGYEIDLAAVHKVLHRFWKPRFFGVRQWEISRCLKKLEIPFREFDSPAEFVASMEPGDVAIVLSWNRTVPFCHFTMGEEPLSVLRFQDPFGGAHGVAVEYSKTEKWIVYNRYSNRDKPYEYPDFRSFLPFDAQFVKGFLLSPAPKAFHFCKDPS